MPDTPTIAATAAEKQLLWLVRDLVIQECLDEQADKESEFDGPRPVFLHFIGIFAQAIATLADYGLVTELTDNGGRVVSGKVLSLVDTAKKLQTGVFAPKGEPLQKEPEIGAHL